MKQRVKTLFVLVAVFGGGMSVAQAHNEDKGKIELFPAEYDGSTSDSGLRFLSDDPFILEIAAFQPLADRLSVSVELTEKAAKRLQRLTRNYLDKRLALVVDGTLISAPVVKSELEGRKLVISSATQENFETLVKALQASTQKAE